MPGLGDLVGFGLSVYIVEEARKLGAPPRLLQRMRINILIDLVAGTIPILGDIFDAGWKANAKNVALLERHLAAPGIQRRRDRVFLAVVVGSLVGGAVAGAAAALFLLRWIINLF